MCDPLSAAAAVMTVGGMYAQNRADKVVAGNRDEAARAEADRQAALDREAGATFDTSLHGFDRGRQDASLGRAQGVRASAIDTKVGPTDPAVPVAGSAPKIVKSTIARAMSDALARGKAQGVAQGNLAGYGDLALGNSIDLTRSGQKQATFGDFSRRSSGILPFELEAANRTGGGLRSFGKLLSAGGQVAGLASAFGAGPSFGELFGGGAPTIPYSQMGSRLGLPGLY